MTSSEGIPLAIIVSAANEHDVNFILPLVYLRMPRIGGLPGRPRRYPVVVRADAGYTSKDLLKIFRATGIEADIPQRQEGPARGLGKRRWKVERAIAWLKQHRRVGIRRERSLANYVSFVTLASAIIAFKQLIAN